MMMTGFGILSRMRSHLALLAGLVLWFGLLTSEGRGAVDSRDAEFFEKRVRPVLVERCYSCHGEKLQWGGLRVDSAEGLRKGGARGSAFVAGKPEESLLIKAISYKDAQLQMPPTEKLPDEEVAALTEWIRKGAPDPRGATVSGAVAKGNDVDSGRKHWAYQAPKKPPVPNVRDTRWPRTDIDRFILAKLEDKGLRPVGDAKPATWLRRVYFDLTGLPPTPDEIQAFVNDTRPKAHALTVDKLLGSRSFGERWGRHWLDVTRFGESVTLRGFIFKEAWRYRDYVIESFNEDVPYDRFLKEQVAGDLLPFPSLKERQRGLIATTFLMLGNTNLEEQDKKQLEMDVVDEQLDTLGKAFVAQTIGCARCHDHKFDPIPTRDYYAMAGILRNVKSLEHANVSKWMERPLPLEESQEAIYLKHEAAVASLQAQIKLAKESAKALAAKSAEVNGPVKLSIIAAGDLPGIVVDSSQARAVGEWKHSQYSSHYIGDGYLHDLNVGKSEKTLTFLPDITRPGSYEVRLAYVHAPNRAANVPVTLFHADGETLVHVNQQEPPTIDGHFVSLGQFRFEGNGFGYALVSSEGTSGYVTADAVQFIPVDATNASSSGDSKQRTNPATSDKAGSDPASAATSQIKALEAGLKKLNEEGPARPMVMSVQEETGTGDIPVHFRGSVHTLGEKVPRGFLQVATYGKPPSIPANESGRRELGEWLASPNNPLTARVMANRVWLWLFGSGLVRTVDNFGTTGEEPSHPELLDYLALQFVEQGWSVKKLVREIVLSRVYQLNSAADGGIASSSKDRQTLQAAAAKAAKADPENRLLWRMNRRRLEAECIRDTILSVSGELQPGTGGSTIAPGTAADYAYKHTSKQRSVYLPVLRNALPELFEVFDFPDTSRVTGQRNVTTVAPQSLFLLNHPFVMEQARYFADRLLAKSGSDNKTRVEEAYRLALGRRPAEGELRVALRYLGEPTASSSRERLQAWAQLCHSIFASLDFRYLD
jgi:hypothetical protein